MSDSPAPQSKSIFKKVSKKFKKAGKSFRKSLSKSKSDKPTWSASSFNEASGDHRRPEGLRRSLSESDSKGGTYSRRPSSLSPLGATAEEEHHAEAVGVQEKEAKGARSSFADEVDGRESGSDEEATGLITPAALVEAQASLEEDEWDVADEKELGEVVSVKAPEEVGAVMRIETPKVARESKKPLAEAMDDLSSLESHDAAGGSDLEHGSGTGSEVLLDSAGEVEAQLVAEEPVKEDVGVEVDGFPEEDFDLVVSGLKPEPLECVEEPTSVDMGHDLISVQKNGVSECSPQSKLLEAVAVEVHAVPAVDNDNYGSKANNASYGKTLVSDVDSAKDESLEGPNSLRDVPSVQAADATETGEQLIAHKSTQEKSEPQVVPCHPLKTLQAPNVPEPKASKIQTYVAPTGHDHIQTVTLVDEEAQECEPVVASQTTRDFSVQDVEKMRKLRNSCSQVDELRQSTIVQGVGMRQSADISVGQLQECTTGSSPQERVPRWRWVRKAVAPVTFVTGAVILKIVAR